MAVKKGSPMSVRALTSNSEPGTLVLVMSGRIEPDDVQTLCDYVCAHLQSCDPSVVVCDLSRVVDSDAVAVEALARLQLAARRRGCKVKLRKASKELLDLLALTGLDEVVPVFDA